MSDPLDVAAGDDLPRAILLGEAPSKGGDRFHMFPLSGRPAKVLCELSGIPPQADGTQYGRWTWALYERFDCRNVFTRYADATPWSAPRARDAARELLAELAGVDLEADPAVVMMTSPTVVVCLGRRVQAAVFGALDGNVSTKPSAPARWGTGWFGDFGVWAAPWEIHTPIVRQVCRHCGEVRAFREQQCLVHTGGHEYADLREQRWAPHVVTIPHPSGLNRLLNDEAHRARCGEVLRRALELAAPADTVGA